MSVDLVLQWGVPGSALKAWFHLFSEPARLTPHANSEELDLEIEFGDRYEIAVMERYHTLKVELVYGQSYRTRDVAQSAVFDYIEIFHNT